MTDKLAQDLMYKQIQWAKKTEATYEHVEYGSNDLGEKVRIHTTKKTPATMILEGTVVSIYCEHHGGDDYMYVMIAGFEHIKIPIEEVEVL